MSGNQVNNHVDSYLGRLSKKELEQMDWEFDFETKMVDKYIDMQMDSVSRDVEIQKLTRQFENNQSKLRNSVNKTSSLLRESDEIRIKIDVLKTLN